MAKTALLSGLDALESRLRGLASGRVRQTIHERVAERAQELVDACFEEGRSPDGTPWEPLANGDTRTPLEDLQASIQVEPTVRGVRVTSSKDYAAYHQHGDEKLPARPFLPTRGQSLPPAWRAAFAAEARSALREALTGRKGR